MYRRVLATGVTAAAIVGAGATAMAVTGSDTTSGTPSTASSSAPQNPSGHHPKAGKHGKRHGFGKLGKRLVHAQIVTKGKNGFVTHDLIRGTVSSVSGSSITVLAADRKSETFAVTKDTKVRSRTAGAKGSASSISKVAVGDTVFVAGTGTSTLTAKHVVDLGKK